MILTIQRTNDAPNVINKNVENVVTFNNVKPFEPCDILEPKFVVEYNPDIYGANYCYCDTFARSYFITDISILTAHRMLISCSVDVLQTYGSNILNCEASVIRSESVGSTDIPDGSYPVNPSRVWYEGIILQGNEIGNFIDLTPYIIGVNASYT